jgi:prepilin-type processing-associated H-X9-DG protein
MKSRTAFHKRDLVIVLACVVYLLMNLGAIGGRGRARAKEMVCLSNLRPWSAIFQMHVESNDGFFISGYNNTSYWWIRQLDDRYKDWKSMKIWFCPTATVPTFDENGTAAATSGTFNAWGIFYGEGNGPNGASGSYGLNGYLIGEKFAGRSDVPVFVDALRFDLWPRHTDPPPPGESMDWSANNMARACINRHNGGVNVLFADWSSRKVGLKELWKLKWHQTFHTDGPWTKRGGVQPSNWPHWMRNFREY